MSGVSPEPLEKGRLTRLAGKIFTGLAAAAIAIPLLGVGQGFGIAPGDMLSDSTYINFPTKIEQVIENYKAPEEGVVYLKPVGPFREYYSGGYSYREGRHLDTDISFYEGLSALGVSALFSAAGLAAGRTGNIKRNNAILEYNEQFTGGLPDLYREKVAAFVNDLPARYANGIHTLSSDDLGKLVLLTAEEIKTLPAWMKDETALMRNTLLAAGQGARLDEQTKKAQPEIATAIARKQLQRLYNEQAGDHPRTFWGEEPAPQVTAATSAKTSSSAPMLGAGLGLAVIGSQSDNPGIRNASNGALAGAGMAMLAVAAAAAVGIPSYMLYKSAGENFRAAHPELFTKDKQGAIEMVSAKDLVDLVRAGAPAPQSGANLNFA